MKCGNGIMRGSRDLMSEIVSDIAEAELNPRLQIA